MASGGSDDLIHLYDLKDDKDLGFLMNPAEGSVTALQFFTPIRSYNPTHLLAGCSDGTISVWSVGGGWQCMKTLRGHRKDITAIAIHPTGLLALTTSQDGTMKLWDLVKGRTTFTTKVEGGADGVAFSPSGQLYALMSGSTVAVRPVAGGGEPSGKAAAAGVVLSHPRRVLCMTFGSEDGVVITGSEDGALRVWDTVKGRQVLCINRAHTTRIKALAAPYSAPVATDRHSALVDAVPELLATASSDGVIKLWALRTAAAAAQQAGRPEAEDGGGGACLCQAETRARLTTLCFADPPEVMTRRKQEAAKVKKRASKEKAAAASKGEKGPGDKLGKVEGSAGKGGSKAKVAQRTRHEGIPKQEKAKARTGEDAAEGGRSKGGVVSFIDEADVERQRKKKRKVELNSQRLAGKREGQMRRARVPGTKDSRDT